MNVVDSSGWIEFFADGPNAAFFLPAIRASTELIVPTISMYEVYRHTLAHRSRKLANEFYQAMLLGTVVDLGAEIAAAAATLANEKKLAMADAIILATARQFEATLWTQDADFEGLADVKYPSKA